MTEQEKIEWLMRPRYRVMMDYPGSDFKVGQIIEFTHKMKWEDAEEWFTDYIPGKGTNECKWCELMFSKYTQIFKLLEWWEERSMINGPKYVIRNGKISPVHQLRDSGIVIITNHGLQYYGYKGTVPATLSEYQQQLKNEQKDGNDIR